MKRRAFLGAAVALAGCSALGKVSKLQSSFSSRGRAKASGASSAGSLARSYRLDPGFFFGHDVRPFQSVTYVLDLSGSMSERTGSAFGQLGRETASSAASSYGGALGSATAGSVLSMDKKVELVKDHLNASLRGLQRGAHFNIVLFSGDVQKLSPSMMSANTATTTLVSAFVSQLEEGGGTSMKSAIEAGLATDAEDIMVLTDGLPTDATPQQILTMVDAQNPDKKRRIYTVGVGDDQAEDFLTQLAENNGGVYLAYK
ncbi:MAG TPA: VWA domain-containing protein [Polyangiales bacterium]|nr:VWA domain-containing protein [Polyangiales bacterium]